ncbi:MAG TPA: YkvA family protein [Candidatus Limnocylindria bacterium]|jgi:uncharacterized membrane protein YkvA (DUF1232 family)|nr:YkvA family protein [Candidatus Limnocylindria bacterium]
MESGGAFPREEFGALLRRLPNYARLAWALANDPHLSRVRRAAVLAAAAYVVSPIDLLPGIVPVAGQLDDMLVALGAIRFALQGLKPEYRFQRLATAGLTAADIDADLQTTRAIAAWMARSAIGIGRQAIGKARDVGGRLGHAVADRAGRRIGRR